MSTKVTTISDDAEDYVLKTKDKASRTGRVEEKLAQIEDAEVNKTLKEIDRVRAKRALDDLKKGLNEQGSANPILSSMFAGKTPAEVNDMLSKMTPEAIDKLQMLISKLDPTANLLATATQPQAKGETGNEMLLKYLLEKESKSERGNGLTLEGVAALITAINGTRPQVAQVPQGMNQAEMLKLILEFNRPLYDQLKVKDKDLMDAKLNEIKANMPPDFMEQVKYIKEMAPVLGLGTGGTSELDLKLEEMRENREIDMKRLDWEQEKYKLEADADVAKWEQIGKILQGPIGQAIQGIGNAGADRVRGAGAGKGKVGKQPTAIQTQCPNCQHVIYVDAEADTAICGQCGAILQKQGAVQPPQQAQAPQPEPTRVEVPKQAPPAPPASTEEQETEGEEENGPDESEGEEESTTTAN